MTVGFDGVGLLDGELERDPVTQSRTFVLTIDLLGVTMAALLVFLAAYFLHRVHDRGPENTP